jgi:membrane fusion protein (multidrug efflux system)
VLAIGLVAVLAACSDADGQSEAAAPPAMPPAGVSVLTVKPERVALVNELPGRIVPTRIAEVRPRVSGIVVERVFEQGSQVERGDVLYRIDPASFEVQVASAEASLASAKAAQLQASQQAERQNTLRERNVASQQVLESATAALAQANANVAAAEANLAGARLNLEYTEVRAPISGRIGRALITEGALVTANSPESLATIQQFDPVYADFTQSSSELIALRRALEDGTLVSAGEDAARVTLKLDDGSQYPHEGKLLFQEAAVDASTGQVTMRAEIPNPDGDLLPGLYVRVLIEQAFDQDAITVPQQSLLRDAGGNSQVYVVGEDNVVQLRTVQVGRSLGNRYLIAHGLEVGDKVVVEGFQKIGPGATVNPQEWQAPVADAAQAN